MPALGLRRVKIDRVEIKLFKAIGIIFGPDQGPDSEYKNEILKK